MSYDVRELNVITGEISTRNYTQSEKDAIAATRPSLSEMLVRLRSDRNTLLAASDWTQIPNSALTNEKSAEWKLYRQKLRNLPDDLDTVEKVNAVTWPTKPK